MISKLSPYTMFYRPWRSEDDVFAPVDHLYVQPFDVRQTGLAAEAKSTRVPRASKDTSKKLDKRSGRSAAGRKSGAQQAMGGSGNFPSAELRSRLSSIGAATDLIEPLAALNPNLSSTLLNSSLSQVEAIENRETAAVERLRAVIEDLRHGETTVAIWDMDARVGLLPEIIETLNRAQEVFTFFDLQAPMPAGLVVRTEHFNYWVKHRARKNVKNFEAWVRESTEKKQVSERERRQFKDNLWSNDFYEYARIVRKGLGVDFLAGVTQYKVAGYEDGDYFWDYFSASDKDLLLASAFDLRNYSQEAGRPFEVAVAQVVLAQLLVEIGPEVEFHEDRGCLFDFNQSRSSIIHSLREMRIEPECLARIETRYRAGVEPMVAALKNYSRSTAFQKAAQSEMKRHGSGKHDDDYWLKKLDILSAKLAKEQKS